MAASARTTLLLLPVAKANSSDLPEAGLRGIDMRWGNLDFYGPGNLLLALLLLIPNARKRVPVLLEGLLAYHLHTSRSNVCTSIDVFFVPQRGKLEMSWRASPGNFANAYSPRRKLASTTTKSTMTCIIRIPSTARVSRCRHGIYPRYGMVADIVFSCVWSSSKLHTQTRVGFPGHDLLILRAFQYH